MKVNRKKTYPLVENTFNIMKYLYPELNGRKFSKLDISEVKDVVNLYALVISTWCSCIVTEGAYKEYKEYTERMSQPIGTINIQESVTDLTMLTGELICTYEELTEDNLINQLLKSTLQYLYYDKTTEVNTKSTIVKTLQQFSKVENIDLNYKDFKHIRFNNNNSRYKNLLEMCSAIANKKYSEMHGVELADYTYTYKLFKKQMFNYYMQNCSSDNIKVGIFERGFENKDDPEINYDSTDKLILIQTDERGLMILTRLVDISDRSFGNNEQELLDLVVKHIKDYKQGSSMKMHGAIMYVNCNENNLDLNQIKIESVQDIDIGKIVVNLFDVWKYITFRLNEPYKYFIERYLKH